MAPKIMFRGSESRDDLELFSWIVGPVKYVYFVYVGELASGYAIVRQADTAYAVVTSSGEYLACCPNKDLATSFLQRRIDDAYARAA